MLRKHLREGDYRQFIIELCFNILHYKYYVARAICKDSRLPLGGELPPAEQEVVGFINQIYARVLMLIETPMLLFIFTYMSHCSLVQ